MSEERKVNLVFAAENQTKGTLDEIKQGVASTAANIEQSGKKAAKGIEDLGDSIKKVGRESGDGLKKIGDGFREAGEQSKQGGEQVSQTARSMIQSIQRTTAAAEAGEKGTAKYFEVLAKQRGVGGDVLEPYLAQLRAAEAAQAVATAGLGKMGVSAGQTQAALRQLPAQFSDIFVSLQGGQAPLTVFLQQGAQIKDSFGGAGEAAKAMGGYMLGMVNPFTLAAAAVAVLGIAYHQGSQESDAFTRSIVLTGNASGVTSSQLREYAREIDAVVGTQAQAASGLADFVAAGVRGADELRRYTQTAIEWEKATGQAVSKTASQFSDLQKDPLTAVLKLNEGTNFLTVSVYEQIKALDDQGRKTEASKVAMEALDGAMRERSKAIRESLGYIERAWGGIKGAAAEAWDSMLNVGRAATIGDQLAKATAELERKLTEPLAVDNPAMRASREKGIETLKREIWALNDKADAERVAAAASAESARLTGARVAFDKDYAKALDKETTLQEKLSKARKEGLEAGKSEADIKRVLAFVTEEHNKANKGSAAAARAAKKELADQARVYADLAGLSSSYYEELARGQKSLAKGNMTQAQYIKYVEDLIKKQPFAIALAKEEEQARKDLQKAVEDDIKQADRVADKRQAGIKSIEDSLLKTRQEEEAHALAAAANITLAEAMERLTIARLEDHLTQARAGAESQAAIDALERELRARKELQGVLQQKGVREATAKAAKEVEKEWDKTAETIGRTLSDYIMGGGKDAAQYLKRLFATLVLQPMVQTAVGGLLGTGSGAAAASGAGSVLGTASSVQSLWSSFSGGLTGSLGSSIAGLGAQLGSTAATAFGSGIAAGGQLGLFGGGIGQGMSLIGSGAAGSTAAGLGTMAGAALPWVAGAAALFSIIKSFDDSGTPHSGMNARWSAKDGVYKSGEYSEFTALGLGQQWQSSQAKAVGDAVGGLAQTLGTSLDAFALAFGNKAGYVIETGFADDTSKDRAWGGLRIVEGSGNELVNWNSDRENKWAPRTFSDGEEGYKEYLNAVAMDVKSAFVAMDMPAWAGQILKTATDIDTLNAALQQIAAVKTVFESVGKTMEVFAGISGDVQTRLLQASGSLEAFGSNASAFYEGFFTEQDKALRQRELQMAALAGAGLYIDPAEGDKAKELFRKTVEEAMASGQVELAAKLLAMSASFGATADYGQKAMDDLADAAKDAADLAKEAAEKAKKAAADALDAMAGLAQGFAGEMTAARSAMDAAGALWDRLDAAQGGSGTGYARIREQRLWDAMVQADYRQQIELAGQLTDMVLGRHQLEQDNAQKLLDFGKSLRSYVDGLKIGALSPLTTSEKLAEAAKQYADTLTKAKAGDESAMGSLQGISSSYLDLARQYFASSGDYTRIFNGVTGSLDALGVSSQSEAQLQLDVSSQSLDQLRQLQGVLWDAYGQAESEFAVEKDLLQRQVNEMLRTADGIEAVRDLLGGMPAELAAQLNGGAGAGTGSFATLAQGYVSLLGGAGGSSTDPRYVASAMGHVNAANWKSELSNAMGLLTDPGARAQMQAIFDAVAKMKGIDGSHANGLGYVPFDNYMAQLHKGERVLTAEENRAYTPTWSSYGSGGGVEALVSEVKALRVEIVQLKASGVQNAQMLARAQVESNMAAAGDVVKGVGQATVRAAYAETVQPKGYK